MPQMMPINWLMSFIFFIMIFFIFNIMNYYIFNYKNNKKFINNYLFPIHQNFWKW